MNQQFIEIATIKVLDDGKRGLRKPPAAAGKRLVEYLLRHAPEGGL